MTTTHRDVKISLTDDMQFRFDFAGSSYKKESLAAAKTAIDKLVSGTSRRVKGITICRYPARPVTEVEITSVDQRNQFRTKDGVLRDTVYYAEEIHLVELRILAQRVVDAQEALDAEVTRLERSLQRVTRADVQGAVG